MRVTSLLEIAPTPTAVALGNFDGIHRGHCQVIQSLLSACPDQAQGTVVAFDPHPQAFFSGQHQPLLTPLAEKAKLLEALGVDQLVLIPFNQALARLSPQAFVQEILVEQLVAQWVSVGFNFYFGYQRAGTAKDLVEIAGQYQIPVSITAPQTNGAEPISSSAIRAALLQGDLQTAQEMLGRPYDLTGTVVYGQQLGRTIGFPTANLQVPTDKFCPRTGVYSVSVTSPQWAQPQRGVMNWGCRPTVDGQQPSLEVHLLDWSGDLYGHTLTVHLQQFLRSEQKFASLDALKAQIQADCDIARSSLAAVV
ncbi:bifunctional riboflavin kinase/FAD synthetase [Acaryochloris sp. IP29b_bin.148]|uniref:bifunctional riboflavin kinase/FAD synthetase n=1 Tax=Acaryochloris sp. IP29b_bin.148 TaxID=2969218 RepID=UPI002614C6DC|nr:bifunctional riboflavin kinase/FAD synthetase [Acaryochloris sp. IP29b_bin.148]